MLVLDGKKLSQDIKEELKVKVDLIKAAGGKVPHLVAVLVGENPASKSYVGNKIRFCEEVGYKSTLINASEDISEDELLTIIQDLNDDEEVDGYIVQLPLPKHIDEMKINLAIDYRKDVDGFHPMNFGRMAEGMSSYLPATPAGIMEILDRYDIDTDGKHCVVVGRSNIVGTPISILLSRKGRPGNCTVTLAHSRTKDIKAELLRADIIIAAIGIPEFIKGDMVKEGAVVIDVGINRVEDASKKSGYRLVGDVAYDEIAEKASAMTPVPGGVGPMTVTALMLNTLKAATKEIYL
ncbi:MAG: bifunctional 5,10-methylene-tetrahydrofolate dehydrogenase/5,10-methylene-tetrahydrofolate cyclohydrolase [Saprospiraceae bacterium]|nr:bifunctional 5,10-methylene-tetrahydrofolate dehydrogenase/5,10-methylene-tetrahydrofolate cyclohydrolase [Saprospiraceae bacterium]